MTIAEALFSFLHSSLGRGVGQLRIAGAPARITTSEKGNLNA